jgi:hypothetical protein
VLIHARARIIALRMPSPVPLYPTASAIGISWATPRYAAARLRVKRLQLPLTLT